MLDIRKVNSIKEMRKEVRLRIYKMIVAGVLE